MTLTDKTKPSQYETLSLEFDLPQPPEKVWRALTDPALLSEWLLPVNHLEVAPGATFRFQAPPQPEWDGRVDCRLLAVDEPRTLSWSWVAGDIDTVVTFTLTPTASGTSLSVEQSGFKADQKKNFGGARYGWRMMGERLQGLLAGSAKESPTESLDGR